MVKKSANKWKGLYHTHKGVIRYFMNNKMDEDLWNYISALRGPDNVCDVVKDYTTAFIRGAQLDHGNNVYDTMSRLGRVDESFIRDIPDFTGHFTGHIVRGLMALAYYYDCRGYRKGYDICKRLSYHISHREWMSYIETLNEAIELWQIPGLDGSRR